MCYHAKPYRPGQRLLGSVRGWTKRKRVREGDYSTSKQNTSTTVGNSRPRLQSKVKCDQDYCVCLLSPLLRMIWTVFSRYCWGTRSWQSSCSGRRQSRSCPPRSWLCWLSSAGAREGSPELGRPDCHHQKYQDDDLACICRLSLMCFVYFLSSHPLAPFCTFFIPSENLATFGPDDRVLHGNTWSRTTQRVKPYGNDFSLFPISGKATIEAWLLTIFFGFRYKWLW